MDANYRQVIDYGTNQGVKTKWFYLLLYLIAL